MSRRRHATLVALAILACAPVAGITLDDCTLTAVKGRVEAHARCGSLAVPLNPDDAVGDTLRLFVAVVPALAPEPIAEPLALLAGGPGQAATELYTLTQGAFARINAKRDILLVDQRGTGSSQPLQCGDMDAQAQLKQLAASPDDLVAETLACLQELEADPRWFTTSAAVRDLEAVRAALGYERLNLYAVSYGTRVAQHYIRRHPERVRGAILDGVVPMPLALGPDIALNSQTALDALFERCAEDAACATAFTDLPARLDTLLERLDATPPALDVPHPLTGERVEMTLTRLAAVGAIRLLLYAPQSAGLLPTLLNEAFAERYVPLAAQLVNMTSGLASIAYGLNFAVLCTEDVPFWGEVDWAAQDRTYMGATTMEVQRRICGEWPSGFMDEDLKAPLTSDVPALFLSGEFDPITPPRYTQEALAGFSRGVEVFGRGQGHGVLASGCVPRLMAEFIDHAEEADWQLDASCAEDLAATPMFVSPMGPGP